ncbi:MAG: quinol:cytochrome C oxidoreductase [bacterium]|nr:quinol:cytochrome C oxidoreductase [bacterium]
MKGLDITHESRRLDSLAPRILKLAGLVGVLGVAGALALSLSQEHGIERLLETYLVSFSFFLSLSLGALFFVLLQHVTRAGWSVVVRRIAEGLAANIWLMALLVIPVILGVHHLYHWSHEEVVAADAILSGKSSFLNLPFFVVRLVIYFSVWSVLARYFFRGSTQQDSHGEVAATITMERRSAPGMILFALSLNFAAFDLLMSLDPHWFSTIFGVYFFASSVVCFFAFMPIVLVLLQRTGRLQRAVTTEHYHDIGKMLFAFVVFWAYIAFSQYMLIWYGNIPEETGWFLKRQTNGWVAMSLVLLFGHFIIPFLALISRHVKRRPVLLALGGVWMLVMHWLDLYWLVMPEFSESGPVFGALDLLVFCGLGGVYVCGATWLLKKHSLVPERDPRLAESLAFENA